MQQLTVVAWIVLWSGLGLRSWWRDDSRFGWGMLGRNIEYLIVYHWIDETGRRIQYFPGEELRDKAEQLRPRRPLHPHCPLADHERASHGDGVHAKLRARLCPPPLT